jgi:hypothetical protein
MNFILVEAIIFLAPLSFHLVLDEDPKVNRVVCINQFSTVTTLIMNTRNLQGRFYWSLARNLFQQAFG